ncbi:FecR family protein [Echinicola sp. 20G]|uniref:FecR family protein n=1 Tax=Echinicola sp. 20G TaxID=2781961 RepID=UPI001910DFBD|nr:FecR family protein [Echinicola sp. 20G]
MKNYSENIDFSIIWKKIHSSLSEEEEQLLRDWLEASQDHQAYFNKVSDFYKRGSQFEDAVDISKKDWPKVSSEINIFQPKRKNKFMVYVASLAATIALILAVLAILKPALLFQEEAPLQANSTIIPGTEKAILLMDDGSSYDLSSGNDFKTEEGGAKISIHGNKLEYSSEDAERGQVKYNTLVIPRGGHFKLTLSDGTQVWMNAGSTLKYPTAFVGGERKVELTGEAFFEVARNEEKPFKVISGGQVVQVLGTAFCISSYQDQPAIYTTLVEGKVNVYLEDQPEDLQSLSPNEQSVWVKDEKAIMRREVDVMEYVSWKDGWFYFKDKQLDAIMMDMARWYDISFQFESQEAKKIPFTGKIRRYENLEDLLKLLEKTREVEFTIERRNVIIK